MKNIFRKRKRNIFSAKKKSIFSIKKVIASLVISTLVIILLVRAMFLTTGNSYDIFKTRTDNSVTLFLGSPKAYIDGGMTKIDEANPDVMPVTRNNRTLVPIRFISSRFGATVSWDEGTKTATITLKDKTIKVTLGQKAIVINGTETPLDVASESIGGRIFIPLRALSDVLGKSVFWDNRGLIVLSDSGKVLDSTTDKALIDQLVSYFSKPISYETKSVTTSVGKRNVKVITVNPKDPDIRFEVNLPKGKINQTGVFENIVKEKGAFAAINANFFNCYDAVKDPAGHILVNGKLVYMESGMTTVGFSKAGEAVFSKADTFVEGKGKDDNHWTAYEINTLNQKPDTAIMYTPERGDSVNITVNGYVAVIVNDAVASSEFIQAPKQITIPQNGYVVFTGEENDKEYHNQDALAVGSKVSYGYSIIHNSNNSFKWEDMNFALSGGPDLILNGQICPPSASPSFVDENFTTLARLRTAIGATEDGKLLLVSTPEVTIAELKEIMSSLGAYNSINLDGGASSAMYYDGKELVKPGRELETVLYVSQ